MLECYQPNTEDYKLWSYIKHVVEVMGIHGQSDEEPDEEQFTSDNGLSSLHKFLRVKKLSWHHPSITELLAAVDKTPCYLGTTTRGGALTRIRTQELSNQPPPQHLNYDLFADGYLEQKSEYWKLQNGVKDKKFGLWDFSLHGFQWPLPTTTGPSGST